MNENTSKTNFACCMFLCAVALGLAIFCLALTLVCSRQHLMKHGYSMGNLERTCSSYERKISELNRKILSMSTRSSVMERAAKGVWKQGPAIVHVSRRDVQNYALAAKKQREGIVAKNFSRAN